MLGQLDSWSAQEYMNQDKKTTDETPTGHALKGSNIAQGREIKGPIWPFSWPFEGQRLWVSIPR